MTDLPCTHLDQIQNVTQKDIDVCKACLSHGDTWVSLRMCLTCGNVGCCDSSKNKHATKHFETSGHPVMRSVTDGEDFTWCYIDKVYL